MHFQNLNLIALHPVLLNVLPKFPNHQQDTLRVSHINILHLSFRCNFDFASFARDNGLSLLGATWMIVPNDAYVNATWITAFGDDRGARCNYIQGYDSCQDDGVLPSSPRDRPSGDGSINPNFVYIALPPPAVAALIYALYYYYYRSQ